MQLDFRSVVFTATSIAFVVALLMGFYASLARPRRREVVLWAYGYASLCAGSACVVLRDRIPDLASIVLGNSLIIGAMALIGAGLEAFRGSRPRPAWGAAAVALIAASSALLTYAWPSLAVRIVLYSVATLVLALRGALIAVRGPSPAARPFVLMAAADLALIAACAAARIWFVLTIGAPAGLMRGAGWDSALQALNGALMIVLALAFILLEASFLNEELAAALRRRELLLREMAHRTKNDLALVDSLISLEESSGGSRGGPRLEALRERIRCVAEAHDRLSRSADPGRIGLREYLEAVADGLSGRAGIEIERDFGPVDLPFSLASPLGLVMYELAVNALKYAFPDGRPGRVRLASRVLEGGARLRLEVSDDGVGTRWPPEAPGLGATIVESFAGQLGGRLELAEGAGSSFALEIPLPGSGDPGR